MTTKKSYCANLELGLKKNTYSGSLAWAFCRGLGRAASHKLNVVYKTSRWSHSCVLYSYSSIFVCCLWLSQSWSNQLCLRSNRLGRITYGQIAYNQIAYGYVSNSCASVSLRATIVLYNTSGVKLQLCGTTCAQHN